MSRGNRGNGRWDRRRWRKHVRPCPPRQRYEVPGGIGFPGASPPPYPIQHFRFSCFQRRAHHEKCRGGTKVRDATFPRPPAMKTWKLGKFDHSGGSDQNQILPSLAVIMPKSFRARSMVDALIARASPCDFSLAAGLGPSASASNRNCLATSRSS